VVGEPQDPVVFMIVVRRLLMKLGGKIYVTPACFQQLWLNCRNPRLIARITSPVQDLKEGESLMSKLLSYILLPTSRTRE
jgi:hypothetical protein